jgi:predicted phosphoribosyltransferase
VSPGKSGELIARHVNQRYRIAKHFPSEIKVLQPDERFIVVDDGTYTGAQLCNFLKDWEIDLSHGRVAIAVAIAHETAYKALSDQFPSVPLFYGELLTREMCFEALCLKWVEAEQWQYDKLPLEVYVEIHRRHQSFEKGNGANGYGDIGALVAFEHGVPDDSIQLLWDTSPTWQPLVDRGT